ncbi:MAG TPA: PAS domain S-box protein [Thermomicrobiales bacterium]|nr:PAS domain S-box protein [Thermomicrobiales bacterium]
MIDDVGLGKLSTGMASPPVLESREHLEAILQGVADGVVVHDTDGIIAYANDAAAQMLRSPSPISLLGHSIDGALTGLDLFDAAGTALSVADLPARDVFDGEPSARRSIVCRHRETGEERWWIVSASPIRGNTGLVDYAVCILRDATERVRGIQANSRLAAIVASSADAIIGKSLDAIITSWNPAAERLYGYTADQAVGQPIAMLVPLDRPDELPSIMASLRAGESVEALRTVRVRKDGTRVDVQLTISPVHGQDGRITGASTIARDVTEQHRAENALRLLAEAGEVLGASLDYEATLASVAELIVPRLADWCSVNMVDETGRQTQIALAHSDPEKVNWVLDLQKTLRTDDSETGGIALARRTGEPVVYRDISDEMLVQGATSPEHLAAMRKLGFRSGVIVPMMSRGRAVGTMSLVYAESGRLYRDDEIELAKEIARRAAIAVDNARLFAEAQRAVQARQDFLLTASHELRTPLTSVKAAAQLVARHLDRPEPNRKRIVSMVANLQGEISRLEALSFDLLDAARIQRGQFELELGRCDLVAIASDVMSVLSRTSFHLPSHLLVLDAEQPVTGTWDERRLRQVVSNLVSNALKYSPEGGEVRVRIRQVDGTAILSVEDHGIGIDQVEATNLFQPFERTATVRQSIGGVGLGLYITKQIVDAHDGTITVDSMLGAGSVFSIRFPGADAYQ